MKTRIMSGAFLVVLTVATLLCGGWLLFGVCLLISLIGMYELYKVLKIEKSLLAAVGYLTAIFYYILVYTGYESYNMLLIVLSIMFLMTVYVFTFPRYQSNQIMITFLGIFYVALMLSYIYKVRILDDGIYLVWLIFVASWGNDTFAYFSGVFLGKHKMAPKLSPKKSVEGAIGGIVGATVLGAVYGAIVSSHMSDIFANPVFTFATASCIGSILAIVGDLAASAIKRNHDIKDYGNLIPGHGGILDRFDSVIFTAPAVYWAVFIINKL